MTENTGAEDAQSTSDDKDDVQSLVDGAAELFDNLRDVFARSREEILRGAQMGKVRIDLYQLRKDRELLLGKLGAAAFELLQARAIAHPELVEVHRELKDLDTAIARHEDEVAGLASGSVPVDVEAEPAAEPAPEPVKAAATPKPKAKPRKKAPARTRKAPSDAAPKKTTKKS